MTRIRHAADTVLRRSPVQRAFRGRAARRVAVLAYHGVDSPQQFGRQLDLLQRQASPVSLADVVAAYDGGPPLPARPVLLTFDDGHPSLLRAGLPLLRARGIPAVAFVLPGLVGTHRPFWWDEAAALHEAGARAAGAPADPDDLVRWLKTVPDPRRHEVLAEMRELSAVDGDRGPAGARRPASAARRRSGDRQPHLVPPLPRPVHAPGAPAPGVSGPRVPHRRPRRGAGGLRLPQRQPRPAGRTAAARARLPGRLPLRPPARPRSRRGRSPAAHLPAARLHHHLARPLRHHPQRPPPRPAPRLGDGPDVPGPEVLRTPAQAERHAEAWRAWPPPCRGRATSRRPTGS